MAHSDRALPHQSLMKTTVRTDLPIDQCDKRQFLNWGSFLCQDDKIKQKTHTHTNTNPLFITLAIDRIKCLYLKTKLAQGIIDILNCLYCQDLLTSLLPKSCSNEWLRSQVLYDHCSSLSSHIATLRIGRRVLLLYRLPRARHYTSLLLCKLTTAWNAVGLQIILHWMNYFELPKEWHKPRSRNVLRTKETTPRKVL